MREGNDVWEVVNRGGEEGSEWKDEVTVEQ